MLLILGTSLVTTITGLSMSAISTNGVIKGGKPAHKVNLNIGLTYHLSLLVYKLIPVESLFCSVYLTYLFIYFLSDSMILKRVILCTNHHTTNKCTNFMSFIFKSLF